MFTGSNVLFGAALGNVVRGVPLTHEGTFHLTFFTHFRTDGAVGLLDWYTLSMVPFCVLMLTAHGATYLTMRTEGVVHHRAKRITRVLWLATIPMFASISLLTGLLQPELLRGLVFRPIAWVPLSVTVVSVWALVSGLRRCHERRAFLGSIFLLFGLLTTGATVLFPVLLFSTMDAADQLTAFDCAAPSNLRIAAL